MKWNDSLLAWCILFFSLDSTLCFKTTFSSLPTNLFEPSAASVFSAHAKNEKKQKNPGPLNSNFVSTKIDWREVSQVFAVEGNPSIFISRWRFSFTEAETAAAAASETPVGFLQGVAGLAASYCMRLQIFTNLAPIFRGRISSCIRKNTQTASSLVNSQPHRFSTGRRVRYSFVKVETFSRVRWTSLREASFLRRC